MELRFDAKLHSNVGNENSDAGHIKCSHGPQVLHPWFKEWPPCFQSKHRSKMCFLSCAGRPLVPFVGFQDWHLSLFTREALYKFWRLRETWGWNCVPDVGYDCGLALFFRERCLLETLGHKQNTWPLSQKA